MLARAMTLVPEEAFELDADEIRRSPPDREGLLCGPRAAAPHADVELHDDPEDRPLRPRALSERLQVHAIVDGHRDPGAVRRIDQPLDAAGVDHLVRHQDVGEPRRGHRLGLGRRRRRHADRAVLELHPRELRALVRLDVRAEASRQLAEALRHERDVAGRRREVQHERRGLQLIDRPADRGARAAPSLRDAHRFRAPGRRA
jgi:hypothetical protein